MAPSSLLILPLSMLAYYQAIRLTGMYGLNMVYFFIFYFTFTHMYSSSIAIWQYWKQTNEINPSVGLIGIGPTMAALFTWILITIIPFIKWPFYLFKGLPYFNVWITPFLMGMGALTTQIITQRMTMESK